MTTPCFFKVQVNFNLEKLLNFTLISTHLRQMDDCDLKNLI